LLFSFQLLLDGMQRLTRRPQFDLGQQQLAQQLLASSQVVQLCGAPHNWTNWDISPSTNGEPT
jgi:hypothetical protein